MFTIRNGFDVRKQKATKSIEERLWAKVAIGEPDQCWEWQGWRHPKGHGQIGRGRRDEGLAYCHVVSWEIANNQRVPAGMIVRHKCDNPPCCNPKHLIVGTNADNTRDMIERRRHTFGEAYASKLSDEAVQEIRRRLASGQTQQSIADHFGVSPSMVGAIGRFKRWVLTEQDQETRQALESRPAPGKSETCPHGHLYAEVGFYKTTRGRQCKACHKVRMQRYMDSGGREKKQARTLET